MIRESLPQPTRLATRVEAWELRSVSLLLLLGGLLSAGTLPLGKAPGIGVQWSVVAVERALDAYSQVHDTPDYHFELAGAGATGGMDSISAQLRNCLAVPSFACWEQAFIASAGSIPKWFDAFRQAFDTGMRQPGKCQEVARAVSQFFKNIGGNPVFVELQAKQYNYMSLDLPDGTSPGITKNGYHVVVRLGDRIYDAFTGPAGMKAVEYLAKIQARFGYTEKTLTEL
jgi:hypothetical protein